MAVQFEVMPQACAATFHDVQANLVPVVLQSMENGYCKSLPSGYELLMLGWQVATAA